MPNYSITQYSFQDIIAEKAKGIDLITEIEQLAAAHFRPKEIKKGTNYLLDEIKYRDLIECDYNNTPNFGRVFLARNKGDSQYIGFILCFDDLFQTGKNEISSFEFPLIHCEGFFQHDIPYLNDLAVLKNFSYCFQLGVLPEFQNQGCSEELLNYYEAFYAKHGTVLLAASIHQSQEDIIWRLKNRNRTTNRHTEKQLKKLDFTYHFLDHYFDDQGRKGLWFRVIQVLNNDLFVKKVNYLKLPKAYNTIIPIQLNQAAISVNRIIKHLDAKLLWSSLFNANNLLVRRYGMAKDNHGFFNSLVDAPREKYDACARGIGEITTYLRDKVNPRKDVVSLTDSFKENSYELFFFKGKTHPMSSFNNASCLSLDEPEKSLGALIGIEDKENVYRVLTEKNKNAWVRALHQYLKHPNKSTKAEWKKWKKNLSITEQEENLLKIWISVWHKLAVRFEHTEEEFESGRQLAKKINDQRRLLTIDSEKRQKWTTFLKLHEVLYQIDSAAMKSPDQYWWCHGMVPISYAEGKNVVGIMFSFMCKKLPGNDKEYETRMNNLADLICSTLSKNMLGNLIKFQRNYAVENGHRFSIAAVTSRNLAHNLGSHILANLDTTAGVEKLQQELPSSFAEELARFNSFIRTKTHHLADMVTSEPVSTVDKWLDAEVIYHFNSQKIVNRFLSGTKISEIYVHYNGPKGEETKDIKVQIPNGDLGLAAFSMILENLVRNSAKYEYQSYTDRLDITVEVFKIEERGYTLRIYDHVHRQPEDLQLLVQQINKLLGIRIFLTDYQIRPSGWGLTEMKAAAAYLRKKVPGLVLGIEDDMEIPLITAHHHQIPAGILSEEAVDTLAYEIYLKRPRNIVLVNHNELFSGSVPDHFQEYGIKIVSPDSLTSRTKEIYSHSFIIYFDANIKAQIENLKRLPLRWILVETDTAALELRKFLKEKSGDEILYYVWQLWLSGYCSRKGFQYRALKIHLLKKGQTTILSEQNDLPNSIIYDDHGRYLPAEIDKNKLLFYHSYNSVSPLGRIINNNQELNTIQQQVFSLQLLEAAITKVIIIDERIQRDLIKDHHSTTREIFERLHQAHIYIPNPHAGEIDLLQIQSSKALADWLKKQLENSNFDFIVLHLGLLESLISSKMEKVDKWINEHIREVDSRPEIILISGRGKPHHFPSSISFQPANIIAEYVLEGNLSKFHLVNILFSSRTRVGS